jgi:transcriptional regulator with XRE-family HTH domain
MDDAGLTVGELRMRLALRGHEFSEGGIRHWMRGGRYPTPEVMQALAAILDVPDYRHVLPPAPRMRPKN